jgi:hypothetical protein
MHCTYGDSQCVSNTSTSEVEHPALRSLLLLHGPVLRVLNSWPNTEFSEQAMCFLLLGTMNVSVLAHAPI